MDRLQGTMIHYPWGSFDAIHEVLGTEPDGRPLAEYWLGAHKLAPSALAGSTLDATLARSPNCWAGAASPPSGRTCRS